MSADDFDRMAALADAGDPDWDDSEPVCGSDGPGGECRRPLGHTDTQGWSARYGNDHWSWDSDQFMHWPVGWGAEKGVCPNCGHDLAGGNS